MFSDPEYDPMYLNIGESCKLLGETIKIAFNRRDRYLDRDQEKRYFSRDAYTKRYNDYIKYMMKKFGYKNKKKTFENMMYVGISKRENKKIRISSTTHMKGDRWDEFLDRDGKNPYVSLDVSSEVLGAVVKYAFTLCAGQGADIVAKALFPDGVPHSFDEYLASIDNNYEKYIIAKPSSH
jgi:hypothetical protein